MTAVTARRVREIGESPTLAISAQARRLRTDGVDVISCGAGEPDVPTSNHIVEAARQACTEPRLSEVRWTRSTRCAGPTTADAGVCTRC